MKDFIKTFSIIMLMFIGIFFYGIIKELFFEYLSTLEFGSNTTGYVLIDDYVHYEDPSHKAVLEGTVFIMEISMRVPTIMVTHYAIVEPLREEYIVEEVEDDLIVQEDVMSFKMKSFLSVAVLLYVYAIGYTVYLLIEESVGFLGSQYVGYIISFMSYISLTLYLVFSYKIKPRYVIVAFLVAMIGMFFTNLNAKWVDNVIVTFSYGSIEFILMALTFIGVYFWSNDERIIPVFVYGIYVLFSIMTLIGSFVYSDLFEIYVTIGLLANVILTFGIIYTITTETHYVRSEK